MNRAILCKITGYNDFEYMMDTPNPLKKDDHLLDDLESIRQLLGDDNLQPPLLTDTVEGEVQIPLLFDMVGGKPAALLLWLQNPLPPPKKPRTRCCCTWTTNCAPLRN